MAAKLYIYIYTKKKKIYALSLPFKLGRGSWVVVEEFEPGVCTVRDDDGVVETWVVGAAVVGGEGAVRSIWSLRRRVAALKHQGGEIEK